MTTFSDEEWNALAPQDKHALRIVGCGSADFEPLRKFKGVGQAKIDSLLNKQLVEQGLSFPRNEVGYRLTDKGQLAFSRCVGRRV